MDDDDETQSRIAHNIREERRVLGRLRAALLPPVRLGDIDFPETGGSTLMGDGWEEYCNGPPVRSASTTEAGNDNDSTAVGGTMQDTVEGPPDFDSNRPAAEVARLSAVTAEAAGIVAEIPNPRMCINHEHCGRAHSYSVTMDLTAYCCDECARTNGYIHTEDCCAAQVIGWHVPGSAEAEQVLNDTTPAEMRF